MIHEHYTDDGFRRVPDELAERLHRIFPDRYEAFYRRAGRTWPIYGLAKEARTVEVKS